MEEYDPYENWPQLRPVSVRDLLLKSNVSRASFAEMVKQFYFPPPLKIDGKWVYPPQVAKFVLETLLENSQPGGE